MNTFTIGNAEPSNMSRNIENTKVCQTKTVLLSICGKSISLGSSPVAGLVARATLQFGHHVCQRSAWSPDGKTVGPELD